jgi:ADP-heptose:LPS heptosyltransferase
MTPVTARYEELIEAGCGFLRSWRLAEAAAAFAAALHLRPECPAAHYLRGEALFLQRRLDEALASHAAALRLGIDRCGGGRGAGMSGMVPGDFAWMSHMLRGDFESAWGCADRDLEARRRSGITGRDWPRHMRPIWDGRPLAGVHVLVRCHHGLGDTIQFARYMPLLAATAASIQLECQPELLPLLAELPGVDRLHPLAPDEDRPITEFRGNAEIDVTELPHALCTTLDTIPAEVPYLRPEPHRVGQAKQRLAGLGEGLAVGLVWAAGGWKPERSIALARLAALSRIRGVRLLNLQRGPEYAHWRAALGAPAMAEVFDTDSVADAAATIAALDLVVTVDTMVAHLAGALGVPVWVMLHYAADWRWLLDRNDSPWYPTMRLFRQPRPGDWEPVVAGIAAALSRRAGSAAID